MTAGVGIARSLAALHGSVARPLRGTLLEGAVGGAAYAVPLAVSFAALLGATQDLPGAEELRRGAMRVMVLTALPGASALLALRPGCGVLVGAGRGLLVAAPLWGALALAHALVLVGPGGAAWNVAWAATRDALAAVDLAHATWATALLAAVAHGLFDTASAGGLKRWGVATVVISLEAVRLGAYWAMTTGGGA